MSLIHGVVAAKIEQECHPFIKVPAPRLSDSPISFAAYAQTIDDRPQWWHPAGRLHNRMSKSDRRFSYILQIIDCFFDGILSLLSPIASNTDVLKLCINCYYVDMSMFI